MITGGHLVPGTEGDPVTERDPVQGIANAESPVHVPVHVPIGVDPGLVGVPVQGITRKEDQSRRIEEDRRSILVQDLSNESLTKGEDLDQGLRSRHLHPILLQDLGNRMIGSKRKLENERPSG